jgi:NAD(P)-dependent dehydrogenase (short-subunit alcohol dehydrogenase family)
MVDSKVWDSVAAVPDQSGRRFVVTGANSGLGYATAEVLARRGAQVWIACRSEERGRAALERLRQAAPKARIELVRLDLADLDDVARASDELGAALERLDGLVANAGLMRIPAARTHQGVELTVGTNHLGHFALGARLFPLLRRTPGSRLVTVSSLWHRRGAIDFADPFWETRPHDRWQTYADSKLMNLLFTQELARRIDLAKLGVASLGAHPGYAATELQEKGPKLEGSSLMAAAMRLGNRLFAQSAEAGALPQLRALTDSNAQNAEYYGPAGLAHMIGGAAVERPAGRALKRDDAERLWEASERRAKLRFDVA